MMWSKILTNVKYTLLSVNFLFLITGVVILAVGSAVQKAYNSYYVFLMDKFFTLPAFCIATGIIIFLIAGFGFYGAFVENYYLHLAFAGSMVLIFVFHLSACIAGYVLKDNTVALVQKTLLESMSMYGNGSGQNFDVTLLWDTMQREFQCCGVTNSTDWLSSQSGLPMSCCLIDYGTIFTAYCNGTNSFTTACGTVFSSWAQYHAGNIGNAGVFLVFAQAIVVAGALWMVKLARQEDI